jgi:FlaG/FlaF family flagellin (archaellin)
MNLDVDDDAVSPVVGVVLTVAISVLLAGVVGGLVFGFSTGLTQNSAQQQTGWTFDQDSKGNLDIQLTTGTPDNVSVRVDGAEVLNRSTIEVGETIEVGGKNLSSGSTVTVVTSIDGNSIVAGSHQIDSITTVSTTTSSGETTSDVSGSVKLNPQIDNATVRALDSNGTVVSTGTTDSNGNYSLSGDGIASVTVFVEGFESTATTHPLYTSKNKAVNNGTVSFDFDETAAFDTTANGASISVIMAGAGTTKNPHRIGTLEQLQAINESSATRSQNYVLISNIDANETQSWNGGDGFRPIGHQNKAFTGEFNGQGYTIDGLTIKRQAADGEPVTGLFGRNEGGSIRSVAVEDATIVEGFNVGILVGVNNGTVVDARVSGNITGKSTLGGVAGSNQQTITNSVADVQITGKRANAGALAGINGGGIGGIENSYAIGDVDGEKRVGGLVGFNEGAIRTSYAAASVNGTNESVIGGFTGKDNGDVSSSYWDTQASGLDTTPGAATGLSTSEMQGSSAESKMTDFDFSNVWETSSNEYPGLVG